MRKQKHTKEDRERAKHERYSLVILSAGAQSARVAEAITAATELCAGEAAAKLQNLPAVLSFATKGEARCALCAVSEAGADAALKTEPRE